MDFENAWESRMRASHRGHTLTANGEGHCLMSPPNLDTKYTFMQLKFSLDTLLLQRAFEKLESRLRRMRNDIEVSYLISMFLFYPYPQAPPQRGFGSFSLTIPLPFLFQEYYESPSS